MLNRQARRSLKGKNKFHVKDVGSVDFEALLKLEMKDETRKKLMEVLRWIKDPTAYKDVKFDGNFFFCDLADNHKKELKRSCKVEKVTPEMEAKHPTIGACRVFSVTEEKVVEGQDPDLPIEQLETILRERPIGHPCHNNDAVKQLIGVSFDTREQRREPLLKKNICATHVDFKAWFDQLELEEPQRAAFRFKMDGELYQFVKIPMGAVQSVEIAHLVATALSEACVEDDDVAVSVYIDNVRFLGQREKVIRATQRFVERCRIVKAELNEDTSDITALVQDEFDFLGETFDYKRGRVRNTKKIIKKILWLQEKMLAGNWTYRQMAATFSLLFYGSNTIGIRPAPYFNALRFYREKSHKLQMNPHLWDEECDRMAPSATKELCIWLEKVIKNDWREIKPQLAPEKWIVTDASKYGWGALCYDGRTVETFNAPWSPEFVRSGESAKAEPKAILNALCRFVKPGESVKIYTDHEALKYSMKKGYSPGYVVNETLRMVQKFGPNVQLAFIRGVWNPADLPSRGQDEVDQQLLDAWKKACQLPDEEGGVINAAPFLEILKKSGSAKTTSEPFPASYSCLGLN